MARALFAIGRMSPCAITRFMCSSGSARTQTVKQEASSNSSVPGSVTMLPLVATTKLLCWRSTSSSASRSARRKVSWPNMSKISLKVAPLRFSISRSSSMKGTPRRSASELAERRLAAAAQADQRDALAARVVRRLAEMAQQQVARFGKCRRRQPLEELRQQHEIERGLGAFVHQLRDGQADGARDPPQQHDRAVAEPGLELGEVALGDFGVACERLARHAALVAQRAHALAEPAQIGVGLAAGGGLGRLCARAWFHRLIRLTCIILPSNRRLRNRAPSRATVVGVPARVISYAK